MHSGMHITLMTVWRYRLKMSLGSKDTLGDSGDIISKYFTRYRFYIHFYLGLRMVSLCHDLFLFLLMSFCIINCIFSDSKRCSVLCNGVFTSKNELYDETHCVAIFIRFNLNNDLSTELRGFPCNISKCLLEVIDFDCFNETLIIQDQGNGTGCEGIFYFELIQVLVVTVKN